MNTYDNLSTTRSIVTDYFKWRLITETITTNRLFILIRKLAYDCERDYNFHFSSCSLINLKNFHYEIGKELFNDGIITWTRIITFISFSAILAEHLIQQEEEEQSRNLIMSSIIDWTTDFIDIELHTWLENENYWVNHFEIQYIFLVYLFFLGWLFKNLR